MGIVEGIGIYERGKYTSNSKQYKLWKDVIVRVRKIYIGVRVCDRWIYFQNFAEDVTDIPFFNEVDESGRAYNLDKDMFGNKIYSKEGCVFLPHRINNFLVNKQKNNKKLPTGVYKHKSGKYRTAINKDGKIKFIGGMAYTVEEAYEKYCKARNEMARELAKEYKGKVEQRVIDFLNNYDEKQTLIEDDTKLIREDIELLTNNKREELTMENKKVIKTRFNIIVREEGTDKPILEKCINYDKCINCCCINYVSAIEYIEEQIEKELNRTDFYIDVRSIINLEKNITEE